MKKILLVAIMAIASVAYVNAQPRAIGANLGGGLGFSYQHGFGESNMLDVDVHLPLIGLFSGRYGVGANITYDWIDPFNAPVPWNNKGEWHWYMGVGGAGGMYSFADTWWYAGVAGHIGIEYDFWFPFQLSLDWRPSFGVSNWDGKMGFDLNGLYGIQLGIRYKF